ncbi:MAG: 16S rRNA (adenine(1518)-N(6)/adenine(1519)-N(6))-dimethyltransferase RsmA [Steroidobacteraceae bacterium]|nr:16S rRNA (adenine(1518)-N(6)/adenine(1519)-N(6))-dimethyltransferase RsmA [Nevskiaceae bacterium]MCP5339405.1 16S rRNA (adenine(1518)-N(6)/adenine(1519)-N(6))-dimethyltransferase RsmA [Nevskiaceae bacterium]MCP5360515.1 16S rRNA (adenine(1518)-N(6)/adenine(1519)-N(6))-dimethyltransferase RsmA [Nevskiaceae bacterium]MCP5472861.1 16S rRNA (adenine(1518)-N(6)/adenine(1519)-N(6))-dimethyltransferase RsmA [Nevskiaceae bacterium]
MPYARKRFGQHFLHDPAAIAQILEAIDARPGEALVEIGPGRGALTAQLLAAAGALDAVEIDRDLAAALRTTWAHRAEFMLHEADALQFDFAALAQARGRPLRVVGNLPYNISTPLLFHLLRTPAALQDLHVMLQREVVERICAAPGGRDYGRLTVMLAPWVEAESLFDVGPGAFRPPPQIWSSVARLRVRRQPAFAVDARYGRVVAAAFAQRRKTLRNALRTLLDSGAIEACGIDPGVRPETLAPAQFGALAQLLPSG